MHSRIHLIITWNECILEELKIELAYAQCKQKGFNHVRRMEDVRYPK
jgi:hypothetical protein